MFVDNQARHHQGAREVYASLMMSEEEHAELTRNHARQIRALEAVRDLFASQGLTARGDGDVHRLLRERLKEVAEGLRGDLAKRLSILRLRWRDEHVDAEAPERAAVEAELSGRIARLDEVRRRLHYHQLAELVATLDAPRVGEPLGDVEALEGGDLRRASESLRAAMRETLAVVARGTRERLEARLAELERDRVADVQRDALRRAMSQGRGAGGRYITLHATYDLGGLSGAWGVVAGDWTYGTLPSGWAKAGSDAAGYYPKLLAALREAAGPLTAAGELEGLEVRTLREPGYGLTFAPGRFVSSGAIAGGYGIYNVSLMTGHDARPRDGHPADTVAALDVERVREHARAATRLLSAAADSPGLSLDREFQSHMVSKRPTWSGGRTEGNFVSLRVSGGLSETRPASGALLAVWPMRGGADGAWDYLMRGPMPGYDPLAMQAVDADGHFSLVSLRQGYHQEVALLGATFDERGRVRAITSESTLFGKIAEAIRVDLFGATGTAITQRSVDPTRPGAFTVLKATADTAIRLNQTLSGGQGPHRFFYMPETLVNTRVKLFQPGGPVVLGRPTRMMEDGSGLPLSALEPSVHLTPVTAADLWGLNDRRLAQLRSRGVTSGDLERLHARAKRLMEEAEGGADGKGEELQVTSDELRVEESESDALDDSQLATHNSQLASSESRVMRSAQLSRRVYPMVRATMDDLVWSVVLLLLLAIPFAFAMERLLVGATGVYGRIAGFVVIFLITFGLLYLMHPGFAIATTPVIIFLAFAIILLSSLVIYILIRKFKGEVEALQGRGAAAHDVEVSQIGTLLAAVGMGMSTMRRRPTRTTLTAVTVVMLTFTILGFASFSREVGVRSVYEGPLLATMPRGVLLRNLDYTPLEEAVLPLLSGHVERGGLLAESWWWVRREANDPPLSVARPDDGTSQQVEAVWGVDLAELQRWEGLAGAVLGSGGKLQVGDLRVASSELGVEEEVKTAVDASATNAPPSPLATHNSQLTTQDSKLVDSLRNGGVLLSPVVARELGVGAGDAILLGGRPAVVAGVFDPAAMQRLRHLDGQSPLPVDFQDASAQGQSGGGGGGGSDADELLIADEVQRDYVHLAPEQIVIASNQTARDLGGRLHLLTLYGPGGEAVGMGDDLSTTTTITTITTTAAESPTLLEAARELAQVVSTPVWAPGPEGVERMILTVLTEVAGSLQLVVPLLLGGLIIFGTLLGSISDREREIYTFSALGLSPVHVGFLFFAEAAVYAVVGGMGGQLLAQFVALAASGLARLGWITPPAINYSSTNSLFAIGVVMLTVMVSAIYPALRASKSANPGAARTWKMPPPDGDTLAMRFPFTVSAYDITGVVSFLAEHFARHDDAGLGHFAASHTRLLRNEVGELQLESDVALAPFDLGVTQRFTLTATPSQIPGVDEVAIAAHRLSGARGDWTRSNRTFLKSLRKQFLLWRTLSGEAIESYRMRTLERLGEEPDPQPQADQEQSASL